MAAAAPGRSRHRVGVGEITGVLDDGAVAIEKDRAARALTREVPAASAAATAGRCCPRAACAGRERPALRPPASPPRDRRRGAGAPGRRARGRRASSVTSVVGSTAPGNEPPPTADSPATSDGLSSTRAQAPRAFRARRGELLGRDSQHAEHRNLEQRRCGVAIERERGLQRGERHLVRPDRSGDRVLAGSAAPASRRPDEAARLRPAEQLVAAEEHEVRPRRPARPAPGARRESPQGSRVRQRVRCRRRSR